jgi:hypothetical protein
MEQGFDLHLYRANGGTRRLVDRAKQRIVGGRLILDIFAEEIEAEDWDDGSGWLGALAPLRADVLAGDLRVFYLLWLTAVEADVFRPEEPEPLPGIGPMTGALDAFARFFQIDADLVAAAAERPFEHASPDPSGAEAIIEGMTEAAKTRLLLRVLDGDRYAAEDLRALVRQTLAAKVPPAPARTVAELRTRAAAIGAARERETLAKREAEARRAAKQAQQIRRARLTALKRRGESVWREMEAEIERRNASAYDQAAALLFDLAAIAEETGSVQEFRRRLHLIRVRRARKPTFISRVEALR